MSDHQKDLLLAVLKHHLPMGLRAKVMREVPEAYNAWTGRPVLDVVHTSDRRSVRKP